MAAAPPSRFVLPLAEEAFVARSILRPVDDPVCQAGYQAGRAALPGPVRVMADECGPLQEGANGHGGPARPMHEVERRGGRVHWIDTRTLG